MNLKSRPFPRSTRRRALAHLASWLTAALLFPAPAQAATEAPAVASTAATRSTPPSSSLKEQVVQALRNASAAVSRGLITVQKARTAGDMVALHASVTSLQAVVAAAKSVRDNAAKLLSGKGAQLSKTERAALKKSLAELDQALETLEETSRDVNAETSSAPTDSASTVGATQVADGKDTQDDTGFTADPTAQPPATDPAASRFRTNEG